MSPHYNYGLELLETHKHKLIKENQTHNTHKKLKTNGANYSTDK